MDAVQPYILRDMRMPRKRNNPSSFSALRAVEIRLIDCRTVQGQGLSENVETQRAW